MSDFSESDSTNHAGCDSDGEDSVASSYGSEGQDSRKRPRPPQIQGYAWILSCYITVDDDSDWTAAGPEGNDENEDKVTKINAYLQRLLGAQFESLFGKMHGNVKYFVIFCNLVNILDFGADTNDVKVNLVKVEIRGFLQLQKPTKLTALQKLLSPFAPALSGCWERCVGGLFGHAGHTECLRPESTWFKLHHTGEFGNNNDGKLQAKARRLAIQVFLGSGALAMSCGF